MNSMIFIAKLRRMDHIGLPNAGAALTSCAKAAAWHVALDVLETLEKEWQVLKRSGGFHPKMVNTCENHRGFTDLPSGK